MKLFAANIYIYIDIAKYFIKYFLTDFSKNVSCKRVHFFDLISAG